MRFSLSPRRHHTSRRRSGFTLIELLVVMAVIGILAALIAPNYLRNVDMAEESVLKQQLSTTRDAIDRFYSAHERYPSNLQELVEKRYLRSVPVDPITERDDTWRISIDTRTGSGVFDIHSTAEGVGSNDKPYAAW